MNAMIYKKKSPLLIFLIPAFLFLAAYLYYPFAQTVANTFLNISGLGRQATGANHPPFANYQRLFSDPELATALKNSLLLMVCTVVFQLGAALGLALLVSSIRRGAKIFQTIYFFPIVISATALGLMFNMIFLYKGGMMNQLLLNMGKLPYNIKPNGKMLVEWLDWKDENHYLLTMFLPVLWQYVGFYFVILLTGLRNIPDELYEAAALDGVSPWQRVWYITLPQLGSVLRVCLVLSVTGALKVFDLPWVMFGAGMPNNKGWLVGTYMYDQAFNKLNVDYGSTIAVLIVAIGAALSLLSGRLFRHGEDDLD